MTFEIRPYPEFSWSISRQRKLDQCPRAYFYTYYLGWNGWLDEAPTEARVAYRLGKLTSLDALLGQQIDVRARELEAAARAGAATCPPPRSWRRARARRCASRGRARKNGRAAFEHRPQASPCCARSTWSQDTQPETDRLNEKAGPSMRGLLATSHWERLRARGDEGRVEVPDFAHFQWGGVKVFAAPDLAYTQDGVLHVIDWKTGREDDTQPTQVLLQMWWALETYPELAQAAADGSLEVRGYLEYVAAGATQPVRSACRAGATSASVRRAPSAPASPRCARCSPTRSGTSRSPWPPSSAARAGSAACATSRRSAPSFAGPAVSDIRSSECYWHGESHAGQGVRIGRPDCPSRSAWSRCACAWSATASASSSSSPRS